MLKIEKQKLEEFLKESNAIENEFSVIAFEDALKAWNALILYDELTKENILETHNTLICRLEPSIAGRIRTVNVRVGYQIAPEPEKLEFMLEELLKLVPKTKDEIKKWHIAFEYIHPFGDGNGRTGRILMNWQRIKNDLPMLIIHEGDEQFEYYKWFDER